MALGEKEIEAIVAGVAPTRGVEQRVKVYGLTGKSMNTAKVYAQQPVKVHPDIIVAAKSECLACSLVVAEAGADGISKVVVVGIALVAQQLAIERKETVAGVRLNWLPGM